MSQYGSGLGGSVGPGFGTQTASSIHKKFVTAQDINQLRQCFYAMEEIAQKTIASKNQRINVLEKEIADLKEELSRQSRDLGGLTRDITNAKAKLHQYGAQAPSDDLLDLIDNYQQGVNDEIRRRADEQRQIEARIQQLEAEKRDLRGHLDTRTRSMDGARSLLERSFNGVPVDRSANLIDLLDARLAFEEQQLKERDAKLQGLTARLNDLQLTVDEKTRQMDRLQQEKKDYLEQLRTAKEMLYTSPVPTKFRFVTPVTKTQLFEGDMLAIMEAREDDILAELTARDDEINEVRRKARAVEDQANGKAAEMDKLKREFQQISIDRDSKAQEIENLNEHARTQANVIRRKIEEIEEKDRELDELRRRIKELEAELEDKTDQIEHTEEELRVREEQISLLQRKVQMAQEDVGEKVVVLSLLKEKLQTARSEFETQDDEIDQLSQRLERVESERLNMEETLRRARDDEFLLDDAGLMQREFELDSFGNPIIPSGTPLEGVPRDEELDQLFQTARRSLSVLGEKASYSFAALKAKDDLDLMYNEQLTVTGAEMILRDKKINLLVEKVEISEKYMTEMLRILGQKNLYRFGSARSSFRQRSEQSDAAPAPAPAPAESYGTRNYQTSGLTGSYLSNHTNPY
eukprot:TRINITY_DN2890_c0_g1_i1.p1 TRINITY_DN2890_c0_g1~~TRINITY_DN2890_c0_g1_i1.p1  ORF type:complete len:635 (+),score=184.10 TRINITY_DN2890_c0_g1_i1:59-1963(+)